MLQNKSIVKLENENNNLKQLSISLFKEIEILKDKNNLMTAHIEELEILLNKNEKYIKNILGQFFSK